jgi:hypothetical protein
LDKAVCLELKPALMLLETKHFIAKLEDDIICVQYKPTLYLSLRDAEQMVADRLQYYNDIQAPLLVRNSKVKSYDLAAVDYLLAKDKGLKNINAVAIVTLNTFNRLMATFILRRHPPAVPYQLFTDEGKAIAWLKQFI